ncbi:MAG: hypothetical protein EZS28_046984, partial [Streblomastix strix]
MEELEEELNRITLRVDELGAAGKYEEADKENKKLESLRKTVSEKKRKALEEERIQTEEELKAAYQTMLDKFSAEWDEEMKKFEDESVKQIETMKKKQLQEQDDLKEALDSEVPRPPKDSVELVNLRATEKQLAKLRKFQEALRAKATADALEQQEKSRVDKE